MGNHSDPVGGGHANLATLLNTSSLTGRSHGKTLASLSPCRSYHSMGAALHDGSLAPHRIRITLTRNQPHPPKPFRSETEWSPSGQLPAKRGLTWKS
jgi:hypothetical protein